MLFQFACHSPNIAPVGSVIIEVLRFLDVGAHQFDMNERISHLSSSLKGTQQKLVQSALRDVNSGRT